MIEIESIGLQAMRYIAYRFWKEEVCFYVGKTNRCILLLYSYYKAFLLFFLIAARKCALSIQSRIPAIILPQN